MRFEYHDLAEEQFEQLIVYLCQELLGIAVQGFSKGPDGGRDAKFVGTAQLHPSTNDPWRGTTIIQAKHTNGYNKHFNESDFFSLTSDETIIGEEIPRIKKLRENKELDHYMLFANRRLSANAESNIRTHISKQCILPMSSIHLCGIEGLEMLLKRFKEVVKLANLDLIDRPLIVDPEDLANVIEALADNTEIVGTSFDPPSPRTPYSRKNEINNMSPEYADALRRKYLKETSYIARFLAAPENIELQKTYEAVVDEFQLNIIAKRKNYQAFDEVMNYLTDLLFDRDPILRQHKRLTRAMLFYMYWNCDIGADGDAKTE